MSKVLPAREVHSPDYESADICPRYKQWLRRITMSESSSSPGTKKKDKRTSSRASYKNLFSHRSLKRKRAKSSLCDEPLVTKKSHASTNAAKAKDKPLRSKSFFFRIRQKGRNFGIRCKTSVDLWRKWIKRGIRWDRTVTKEVDIDIIKKPDNKLKDFTKKSIINEVILEEDEEDEPHSRAKAIEAKGGGNRQGSQTQPKTSIIITADNSNNSNKHTDNKNFLVDMSYISKASTLFRHSRCKEEAKMSANISESQQTNGVAKYPMQDLASMDIGHIENIEQRSEGQSETTTGVSTENRPRASHHGAVRRAFNKLKLLF